MKDNFQVHLRQGITIPILGHPGGCRLRRLSCCFGGHLGFQHNAFNRYNFRHGAILDFCPYQTQDTWDQYPGGFDYYSRKLALL
jgi:hypothetical protein